MISLRCWQANKYDGGWQTGGQQAVTGDLGRAPFGRRAPGLPPVGTATCATAPLGRTGSNCFPMSHGTTLFRSPTVIAPNRESTRAEGTDGRAAALVEFGLLAVGPDRWLIHSEVVPGCARSTSVSAARDNSAR